MQINKIYNENCLDTMMRMPDNFIDLVVTSPPYNLGEVHSTGSHKFKAYDVYSDNLPEDEYQEQQIAMLNELWRVTKDGGSVMYNHKNRIREGLQLSPYQWLFKTKWNIKQEIVWFNGSQNFNKCRFYPMTERIYWLSKGKDTGFFNVINQHDLIQDNAVGTKQEHKRAFPLVMAERFIMCFPNAKLIYDPYMGSGTTALAAIKQNRDYIGSELSMDYCKIADNRLRLHLSQQTMF